MRKVEKFAVSKPLYAIDRKSFRKEGTRSWMRVDACWFRRRRGQTVASMGYLWSSGYESLNEFLEKESDGRYGGRALARWDGSNLWAPEMSKEQADKCFEFLKPMLDRYPEIPSGFDGWWSYE